MDLVNNSNRGANQSRTAERYLSFTLGKDRFAIPLLDVKEVVGMTSTTRIPLSPSYFVGMINLRGQVISVIDLRAKLNLSPTVVGAETSVVILDFNPLYLGVVVDSLDSVLAFNPEMLSQSPDVEGRVNAEYIAGVARTSDEQLTLILNLRSVLNAEECGKGAGGR
ncbi:MAG: purine-binding chemotaxis protein CheW [Bdellovibrionales bacterium]|nr:purine-binding chemotaxis protein CheW [Bdellovibrionales bacterium]